MVKNPPTMRETWVQSLDWENPLEEGMAIHSSILAWRILMDRGAQQATVHGVRKSQAWLSIQWLILHAASAGGAGLILGQEDKFPQAVQCSQ